MSAARNKMFLWLAIVCILSTVGCGTRPPEPPKNVNAESSGGVRKEPGPGGFGTVHSTTVQDVDVSWDPVDGADCYTIYWSNEPGVTTQSGERIANATSPYTHRNLTEGQSCYYIVTASKKGKESLPSQAVSAKPEMGGLKFKIGDGVPIPMF